jgi:hypothetical protein
MKPEYSRGIYRPMSFLPRSTAASSIDYHRECREMREQSNYLAYLGVLYDAHDVMACIYGQATKNMYMIKDHKKIQTT